MRSKLKKNKKISNKESLKIRKTWNLYICNLSLEFNHINGQAF